MGYYGYNVGDPGFFSFLGSAFKGIGRAIGGAARAVGGALGTVGRGVISALPTIAQIGAPILGFGLGGPIGGMIGGAIGNALGGGASGNAIPDYPWAGGSYQPGMYATSYSSAGAPIPAAWGIPDTRPPIDMIYTNTYRDEEAYAPEYEEEEEDYG